MSRNPATRELNKEDPTAYVLSANIHRRHMTKGQRAMAVAGVVSVSDTPVKTKRAGSVKITDPGVDPSYLSRSGKSQEKVSGGKAIKGVKGKHLTFQRTNEVQA